MAMREEEPSWGYMVNQGPGTFWETWDDTTNSHNHPMFTASIGPYLFSIVGLDPSTWSIPAYLKMLRNGNANTKIKTVTMHIMPDYNAVLKLGAASGWVATMCGKVK